MSPSEFQDLVAFLARKFGEVEGRLANLEVGFEAFRHDMKAVVELATANGQAIRENRRLIEGNGVRIDANGARIEANGERIELVPLQPIETLRGSLPHLPPFEREPDREL